MNEILILERKGYQVTLQGDDIRVVRLPDAWEGCESLLSRLKENKPVAVAYLKSFDREVDLAVREINDAWGDGREMTNVPIETRHKAFLLEEAMTTAANAGDFESARKALAEWKQCWMSE
jgi:hypothetical protein